MAVPCAHAYTSVSNVAGKEVIPLTKFRPKKNTHNRCSGKWGFQQIKSHSVLRQEIIRAGAEVSGASETELLALSSHSC